MFEITFSFHTLQFNFLVLWQLGIFVSSYGTYIQTAAYICTEVPINIHSLLLSKQMTAKQQNHGVNMRRPPGCILVVFICKYSKGTVCATLFPSLEVTRANRAVCYVSLDIFSLQIDGGSCLQVQFHSRSQVTSPDNLRVTSVSGAQAQRRRHKSSGRPISESSEYKKACLTKHSKH